MSKYNLYKKKINRLGQNSAERLEEGRRRNFEAFLKSSPHHIFFEYNGKKHEAVFEPDRQSEIKNQMDLLCRADDFFKIGDIVELLGVSYMFFYLAERSNSGYNKYKVLRMTHNITWKDNDKGETHNSQAYLFFQQNNMLQNELKSRSRSDVVYKENLKLYFLIMPTTAYLNIGTYLEIETTGINQAFTITGWDIVSTPGVMYVSMDPTYERDLSEPVIEEGEENDNFWIVAGKKQKQE